MGAARVVSVAASLAVSWEATTLASAAAASPWEALVAQPEQGGPGNLWRPFYSSSLAGAGVRPLANISAGEVGIPGPLRAGRSRLRPTFRQTEERTPVPVYAYVGQIDAVTALASTYSFVAASVSVVDLGPIPMRPVPRPRAWTRVELPRELPKLYTYTGRIVRAKNYLSGSVRYRDRVGEIQREDDEALLELLLL